MGCGMSTMEHAITSGDSAAVTDLLSRDSTHLDSPLRGGISVSRISPLPSLTRPSMTPLTVACGGRDVTKYDAAVHKHLSRTSADAEKAMQRLTELQLEQETVPQRVPIVEALVDAGADVNGNICQRGTHSSTCSMTPLMCAAELGHCDVVRCLLEAGAEVNARDTTGRTALMKAAALGRTECIEILHNSGAEINFLDNYGMSALMAAVAAGQKESLWTLLAAGADPNIGYRMVDGCSALHIAAALGSSDLVNALVSVNAEVDAVNMKGETPVFVAAQLGKVEAVAALVKSRALLAKADDRGWTPIMAALQAHHVDVANVLLNSRKDIGVNAADYKDGTSALGLALALGDEGGSILYRLMVAGADPYILAGKQAPAFLQTGSSAVEETVVVVESGEGGGVTEVVQGPIPAVAALAEGVHHGMGADEVIPQFL